MTTTKKSTRVWAFAAVAIVITLGMSMPTLADTVVIEHTFDGAGGPLNGVDIVSEGGTVDPNILNAGGSSIWSAISSYKDNGIVASDAVGSCYLYFGSYINDLRGDSNAVFELTCTLGEVAANNGWISLGFSSTQPSPSVISNNFITTSGLGTMIYRGQVGTSGGISGFGAKNQDSRVLVAASSGDHVFTIRLDFTPESGYGDAGNYGTVTWIVDGIERDSWVVNLGHSFWSILISKNAAATTGSISDLTLTQIIEEKPGTLIYGK